MSDKIKMVHTERRGAGGALIVQEFPADQVEVYKEYGWAVAPDEEAETPEMAPPAPPAEVAAKPAKATPTPK